MRNIFLFLSRSYFFILFLFLEVICVYFIVQNNSFQKASFINSTNAAAGSIYNYYNNATEYLHLKVANESLAEENALLRSRIPNAFYDNKLDTLSINDSLHHQQYTYITAKVVNNTVTKRNNYLTLNRGSIHGVKPESGVVTSGGVVGIVKDVSEHYCSVLSLLHKDTKISAKIDKSNYFGSLVWEGGNARYATLLDIPKHVDLKKGERIVTTSYSSIFPENITIGSILSWEVKPGDNFYTIKIQLSTNFANISYVYIINNLMKEEQKKLEGLIQND
jgi:rod shape-determining protein MreC